MPYEALVSSETLGFLSKVFVAASIVAFGPALVLDYVPAKKVDVHDKADAASPAGKTQRLLLAFAGGGLMAEAALHLLPHLFAPHHQDSSHGHGHGHGHDGKHHEEQALVDTFMLIAFGFLATFAIDRFGGRKAHDFGDTHGSAHVSKEVVVETPVADVAAVGDTAESAAPETEEIKAVEDTAAAVIEPSSTQEKQEEAPETTTATDAGNTPEETPAAPSEAAEPATSAEDASPELQEQAEDTIPPPTDAPSSDSPVTDPPETDASATDPPSTDVPAEDFDAKANKKDDESSATTGVEAGEADEVAPASADTTPAAEVTEAGTSDVSKPTDKAAADAPEEAAETVPPKADPEPADPELTLYGNPKTPLEVETPAAEAKTIGDEAHDETAREIKDDAPKGDEKAEHDEADKAGHHDNHGEAEGGAYATLAVDVLHNVIDGFGIGAAYALSGPFAGHVTALLKLIHEIQHEIGDVATLVQHGMSKHHAIHIQHTTAAGVFLGVAISLGAGAFPSGMLSVLLALSAGATFQLASGTILGPVLAIPAGVGGSHHAFLELLAMAAGAGGVVAVGYAEKMAGLGH